MSRPRMTVKTPSATAPGSVPVHRRTAQPHTGPRPSDYQGAELRPYQGRPGSLDFLALPSVMGSQRIYRPDTERTTP